MVARPSLDETPLSAARWRKMKRDLRSLRDVVVTVGIHGEDGEREDGKVTNVQVAATHEFGNPAMRIPERSFIRSTIDEQQDGILDDMATAMDQTIQSGHIVRNMERVGIKTEVRIRKTLRDGVKPALSPVTIERRRKKLSGGKPDNNKYGTTETPLIDTGQLIQSIASKVEGI